MTNDTLEKWHHIVKQKDAAALNELLADDVMFYSPVMHTPQIGKEMTALYLQGALHVLLNDSFTYVREVVGASDAVLEFEVDVDGTKINGVDMIKWNDDGKIIEFKVMLRPLKAVNMVHKKMREMLALLK